MNDLSTIRDYAKQGSEDLRALRQQRLLSESELISFSQKCGVPISGVVEGDPGSFHIRGWLTCDGRDHAGEPLFHPFRVYPVHKILEACDLCIARSASLNRKSMLTLTERALASQMTPEELFPHTQQWNGIVDLAMLLEPVYWPAIKERLSRNSEVRHEAVFPIYRTHVTTLVETLDPETWRKHHESLRIDAARMDANSELYLLLRVGRWEAREKLRGPVFGALYIRHLAEVLRRAFEEVHGQHWAEEDEGFGFWHPASRKSALGSARPLDDVLVSKRYLAHNYGLFTGSAVRWYVEGYTEYFAIWESLTEPSSFGIEVINLHGVIKAEKDNIALKLTDWLKEDKAHRRFSVISFDRDVPANVKLIRRQVEQDHVIGFIAANDPDFEFANFTVEELVEVAARVDESNGFAPDVVRRADWTGVHNARAFEDKYRRITARKSLKGEEWGRALAKFARSNPHRADDGSERRLIRELRMALYGWIADYDFQEERFTFDPETFEQIPKAKSAHV